MTITKTFPAFRGEGAVESHNYPTENKKVELSDREIVSTPKANNKVAKSTQPKPEKTVEKNTSKEKQPQKVRTSTEPKEIIDASEFTKEELLDPDIPDNLNSIKVLEFKIDKVQKEINAIEGRAPQKLREKLIKTKCRKNVLEQQLGDALSIDDYILVMKKQLDKDKRLCLYFEQEKMNEQGRKVAERIPIIMKELEEAIDFSKSQKKR